MRAAVAIGVPAAIGHDEKCQLLGPIPWVPREALRFMALLPNMTLTDDEANLAFCKLLFFHDGDREFCNASRFMLETFANLHNTPIIERYTRRVVREDSLRTRLEEDIGLFDESECEE